VTLALHSFQEGDALKVVILSIDREKRRISLGLKPSYFDDSDIVADDDDVEDQSLGVLDTAAASVDDDMDEDAATNVPVSDDNSEVVDEDDGDEVVLVTPQSISVTQAAGETPAATSVASLQLGTGFQWSAPVDQALADGSEDSEIGSGDEAGTTHRKKRKNKAIEHDLTAEMHTKTPQSIADFERSLLGSPNSSYLWLQYMSFQLQLAEVDKAREVARRALRTIGFREEKEKLNVWIAMLNLENTYGTPEILESTFKEAARANDSKTIHLRLAAILDQSGEAQVCKLHSCIDYYR
jgi:rRNA biogenesis protein RRP5